ncbi:carboxypeptidase-like regulatory domain-containing protein, partial [Acrocarpospora corrugata]|uniref:carboxypeptidase-like regulatory domain-containing protein n=1 Tax=Acrocarpospora corrugata TaxID=35763 RepID=UPI0014790FCE
MLRSPVGRAVIATILTGALLGSGMLTVSSAFAESSLSTFSGVVRSSSGDPVPSVQVNLDGAIGETGADGSFTVSVLPGVHQLTVNSIPGTREDIPSFQWVGPDIDLSSDVTRDLTLPLAVVNVTLVDESGDPVPDV